MKNVRIPFHCPCCRVKYAVIVNTWDGTHEFEIPKEKFPFLWKRLIVDHYKKAKGLDKVSTWDKKYLGRGLKAANGILMVFAKLKEPVDVALELIDDVAEKADRQKWGGWSLEACESRAGEFLAEKLKD